MKINWVLIQKFKIWKICIHHHELDSFPIPKDFSDEMVGGINDCDFGLYYEMGQHLEDLNSLMNQYFSRGQRIML